MNSFIIRTKEGTAIRFELYLFTAPVTCAAFIKALPFSKMFYHAKISGQEIWIDDAPALDILQENASVFAAPGEMVIAPINPARNKITKCMGIFYGEGKLLDCANIFAKVFDDDLHLLEKLGDNTWRSGAQEISFEPAD
jgi:hypothetical protein